jgi:transcriptional regulator with GAF, ATPase, and Fis domain
VVWTNSDDLAFLRKTMDCMAGSLNIPEALVNTFGHLQKYFPIDAISLHQYSVPLKSLKLFFLITKGRFHFVETTVPVDEAHIPIQILHQRGLELFKSIPVNRDNAVTYAHSKALESFLPYKDRAYLIAMMQSEGEVIGHLCLMGAHVGCFNEEHLKKLALLVKPFTLVMANLLKDKRSIYFQEKLYSGGDRPESDAGCFREKRILGEQAGLKATMDTVYQLRGSEIPALILGETGTGKELIADVIQRISPRKDKPFIKVNCGAIPDTLVDSELFGYEKGAFTGAIASRPGKFEQAHGGTLFLDEIGELPMSVQVRLLRVLQDNVVVRLGSTRSIAVDVRIIAATNRNLEQMMQEGTFREDLYYRLYVYPVRVPPLRDRPHDLPELIHFFAQRAYAKLGVKGYPVVPTQTLQRMLQYSWPGNVRELENLVKRGVTMNPGAPLLLDKLLPEDEGWYLSPEEEPSYFEKTIDARVQAALDRHLVSLHGVRGKAGQCAEAPTEAVGVRPLAETVREAIQAALERAGGKISGPGGAAELLDVNPSTLRSKMRRLGLLDVPPE